MLKMKFTYIVNGALISFSYWLIFAALVNSLCLGRLSKASARIILSSLRSSVKSGIFAFGITVNGAYDSDATDLMALGLPELRVLLAPPKV